MLLHTGLNRAEIATGMSYEDCIAERFAVMQEFDPCEPCGPEVTDRDPRTRQGGRKHGKTGYAGGSP